MPTETPLSFASGRTTSSFRPLGNHGPLLLWSGNPRRCGLWASSRTRHVPGVSGPPVSRAGRWLAQVTCCLHRCSWRPGLSRCGCPEAGAGDMPA